MQAEANLDQTVLDIVDARVGTVIRNKWHVDALVGTGGMAAVYAATHRNGNRVALKILHLQLSIDPSLCRRFKREGYAANAVQHPGVVRVLDDDVTEDGAAFLVMELLEGETAADRAERLGGRLPTQDVLPIIDGVLDILDAAHASGIVHRDIKPENIFFTRERAVKLFDFGIARLRDGGSAGHTVAAMGTPAFMPPEQALGHMEKVDALSDVWATGATMYTLLSGRLVHEYGTANEVLIAAATQSATSLADVAPEVPAEIVDVVDRALAYDKKKRWSTARAMQHALRNAESSLSSSWGRISLVAAEASGSHPRLFSSPEDVPDLGPESSIPSRRLAFSGRAGEAGGASGAGSDGDADTTGAELGVTVPRDPRKATGRARMTWALLAFALAVAVVFFAHRVRTLASSYVPPAAVSSAPMAPVSAPMAPRAAPDSEATSSEDSRSADAEPSGSEGSARPAPSKPSAPHTGTPLGGALPKVPPREKTWLDRRK